MKLNFVNYCSFLICLLPAALITGPLIPEIILLICNIFFLIRVVQEKNFKYFNNIFFKIFLVFWISLNILSLFSDYILYSLKYSFSYIRYGIFVLSIYYLITNNKNFINNFYKSIIVTLLILLFDSYFQYFFGFNIFGFNKPSDFMISSFFNDELILGTYLLRISPLLIALYLFFIYKKNTKLNWFLFYIAIAFPIIFLSGQRTPFYLSILFLLCSIIILKLDKYKFLSLVFALIIISTNILMDQKKYVGAATGYKGRMVSDIIYNYKKIPEYQDKQIQDYKYLKYFFISPSHNSLWFTALELYSENKLVGQGPNTFRKTCQNLKHEIQYSCSTHPHNYFFQLLSETGLIGTLIYIVIYLSILKSFFIDYFNLNNNKKNLHLKTIIFLKLSLLINFVPLFPNGNFFNNHQNILIFLPIGFLLYFLNIKKNGND